MLDKNQKFSRVKVWTVFIILFVCGAFVGVGIANWNHHIAVKRDAGSHVASVQKAEEGATPVGTAIANFIERELANADNKQKMDETLTSCQAVEKVLIRNLYNHDGDCDHDNRDLETLQKLVSYGCPENRDKYMQMVKNKQAVLDVVCPGYVSNDADAFRSIETTCGKIEESLKARMPSVYAESGAEEHIERAKIYAMMAEKGCPENNSKYTELAKQELEIARAVQDDKFNEDETIEVVETYKRLKMQQDAQEILDKAKKLTNPAIDFIMQVEKIINE